MKGRDLQPAAANTDTGNSRSKKEWITTGWAFLIAMLLAITIVAIINWCAANWEPVETGNKSPAKEEKRETA